MAPPVVIAALYRFVRLDNHEALRRPILQSMLENAVRGTLLLAGEGINGTISGSRKGIDALLELLRRDPRLRGFDCKFSYADEMPFGRSRVKLKREIVTMGVEGLDPANSGTYVEPGDWNALISDPGVTLIDTRNDYESAIGSFDNAIKPNTRSFRDFADYAARHLDPRKHRRIAMFCTGGIRCEKSTAYLRQQGFDEVYHLRGGILNYLEQVPQEQSLWRGECFVFDNRVSVNHALEQGSYDLCHACRRPITEADKSSEYYQAGVSCPACHDRRSETDRERFREREKQVGLALERGETHLGAEAALHALRRKQAKKESRRG